MNPRTRSCFAAAAIGTIIFGMAFAAAPYSCDGGAEFYFWCGVAGLLILFALPFAIRIANSVSVSIIWGLGFALFGAAVWVAGLLAAPVRILCRLF
jgi:hypothetical protein